MPKPFLLDFTPGVQRDGTKFDSTSYLEAVWTRFRLGRPRSMGGYQRIIDTLNGEPRKVHCFYQSNQIITHVGTTAGIQQVIFDLSGNLISSADRTPAGFPVTTDAGYTMDAIYDTTSNVVQLVVHVQIDHDLASTSQSTPYLGQIDTQTILQPFSDPGVPISIGGVYTRPLVSGGIVCVQPYVFDFDSYGLVQWSAPNLPNYLGVVGGNSGAGQARISAQKVVAGAPLRGGGAQSPAAVFWSLSEVITATFIGGAPVWAFNTVSPSSSILTGNAIVEYDGLYFWPGVDRFMVFNGTVTEVPNQQNQDFFFDNLTHGQEPHTFGFKVPRYGEIWWCACMFGSMVPNHAVIFNIRENVWYDTPLPNGGRSAGYFAQGHTFPIMAGSVAGPNGYKLWMHETGTDEVDGTALNPVRKYFETGWVGGPKNSPPDDRGLNFAQLEPDFEQTGDLSVYLIGAANARANEQSDAAVPIKEVPGVPQEQFASFTPKIPNRLTRLHIESNVIGGSFIAGKNIGHADPGGDRKFS